MVRDDVEDAVFWLLPENEYPVRVFINMGTQWRTGANGATGLDYSALPFVMRVLKIPRQDWEEVFDGIRIMENAALQEIYKDLAK